MTEEQMLEASWELWHQEEMALAQQEAEAAEAMAFTEEMHLTYCNCSEWHNKVLSCDDCGAEVPPEFRTDMHDGFGIWVLTLCHDCKK